MPWSHAPYLAPPERPCLADQRGAHNLKPEQTASTNAFPNAFGCSIVPPRPRRCPAGRPRRERGIPLGAQRN
eukprot:11175366-Lingulodinium_polyedra.AAC.1